MKLSKNTQDSCISDKAKGKWYGNTIVAVGMVCMNVSKNSMVHAKLLLLVKLVVLCFILIIVIMVICVAWT